MTTALAPADLDGIEFLWEGSLRTAYDQYLLQEPRESLALAAALVETALREQRLGGPAAAAPALLVADLCLARASRLLAENAILPVQVAFARLVEAAAGAAAEGRPQPELRSGVLAALRADA